MRNKTPGMSPEEFFEWAQCQEQPDIPIEHECRKQAETTQSGELHRAIRRNVNYLLARFIRQRGRGHVCCTAETTMWDRGDEFSHGPDIYVYDETPCLTDLDERWSDDLPALIVEVRWPRDNMYRVLRLLRWGVKLVWVVHPEDRTVIVYSPAQAPTVLGKRDVLTGGEAVPDFRCRAEEFFYTTGSDQDNSGTKHTRTG